MPFFRISAALMILWLIQPEAIRAPIRYVAAELHHFSGQTETPAALIAKACAAAPEQCADLAQRALRLETGPNTGAIGRNKTAR